MAVVASPPPLRPRLGLAEAALAGVILIWAGNFSLVKFGVELGTSATAFYLVRIAGALAVLWPAWALSKRRCRFDRRDLGAITILALTGHALFQVGYIHGTDASSATSAALILGLTPVAIAAIAWCTRAESFSWPVAAGLALSVSGVVFVSGAETGPTAHLGNLGLCAAMLAWAIYTVRSAPLVRKYGPIRVTAWSATLAMGMLLAPAVFTVTPDDFLRAPGAWWVAGLVSGGGAITAAHLLWGYATVRLGPTLTGIFSNITPLPAIAVSWLWLSEPLGPGRLVGAGLIIAGVATARARHSGSKRFSGKGYPVESGAAPGSVRRSSNTGVTSK